MFIEQVLRKIKKQVDFCYFIVDETRFFSDHIVAEIKATFLKKVTAENTSVFYASDLDVDKLLQDLSTVSMFSSKRLIVIKDAGKLLKDPLKKLSQFVKDLAKQKTTDHCLIFIASKKPKHAFYQYCHKKKFTYEFKKPYDSKMPFWVNWMSRRENKFLDAEAASFLIEKVGTDLLRLKMELEKVSLYVGEKNKIERSDVNELLYSSRAHSIFELTGAIGHRRKFQALKILERMIEEGESEIFIFTMVVRHLRNLWKAVEWKAFKSDMNAQRDLGIHPIFWGDFRTQRDRYLKAPFERFWTLSMAVDKGLKTSSVSKKGLLTHFVSAVC